MRRAGSWAVTPVLTLMAIVLASIGCLSSHPRPTLIPIATSGVFYPATDSQDLPYSFHDWRYDPDHFLLFYKGSWEFMYTEPVLALYDWRADKLQKLMIPDLDGYNAASYSFSQGPRSEFIAYSTEGTAYLYYVEGMRSEGLTQGEKPALSPDGQQMALWREDAIILVDIKSRAEETLYRSDLITSSEDYFGSGCCIVWSPDGKYIVFVLRTDSYADGKRTIEEAIVLLDVETKEAKTVGEDMSLSQPSWSPDSRLIATIQHDKSYGSEIRILDPHNRCLVARFRTGPLGFVYWFPQGDRMAVLYASRQIYLLDVQAAFGAPYAAMRCR